MNINNKLIFILLGFFALSFLCDSEAYAQRKKPSGGKKTSSSKSYKKKSYSKKSYSKKSKSYSKKSKSSSSSGRCQATTKKGAQCKRNAAASSSYCWQHGGSVKEEKSETAEKADEKDTEDNKDSENDESEVKTKKSPSGSEDVYDKIEKLGRLKDKGLITEEEFQQEKKKLLDSK